MVHDPQAAVRSLQAMSCLAITVARHDVERGDGREIGLPSLPEREVVLAGIVLHEELHRALAVWTVAEDRRRNVRPAQCLGELIGGDLALAQRSLLEVPQRSLAVARLVDDPCARTALYDLPEEGEVGGTRHQADQAKLPVLKQPRVQGGRAHPSSAPE
jgi:hypothetical protein